MNTKNIINYLKITSSISSFPDIFDLAAKDFGGFMQSIMHTNISPKKVPIIMVKTANIK